MRSLLCPRAAALALLLSPALAQATVTVRDTIEPLPPISICQDGATHRTVCTGLRLRPGALPSLSQFEGQPVEVTGTPGMITCPFVDVLSASVVTNEQFTIADATGGTMDVDFFGSGPNGDVFLLFLALDLSAAAGSLPGLAGPTHLDPATAVFVGLFVPLGRNTAYHSVSVPTNPALAGFEFYDQALALHANNTGETTPVDCFRF